MSYPRFLTGGLAALAVGASFTFAGPAFAAEGDDRPCGSPAVDAVYQTVVTDPVFRTVPALTHTAWRWQRDVASYEHEYGRVVSAAYDESDWTREVAGPTEYLFHRTVVDQAAVPAVPGTPEVGHHETVVLSPAVTVAEDEYQHQNTGKLRWERPDWGAQNGEGNGWVKTGNHREREVTPAVTEQRWVVDVPATPGTPAVPEVAHVESQWATSSPGGSWTGPVDSRPGDSSTENQTTAGEAPAGAGWVLKATRHVDAVVETVWAALLPDGWTATGESRQSGATHEETPEATAAAPDGDGWTTIEESAVTVVDVPEHQELVMPGSVDEVLVSPALPATEDCPVAGPGDPVIDPAAPDGTTEGGDAAGPQAAPEPGAEVSPAEATDAATVLPNTGGVPGWMAPAGLATIAFGAVLVRASRRRVL
ncbi:MAG: hypothetical protein J7518_17035 [Nocardioidaceae bacterium]|nr:hypothetical protein [Nocardioidaceae bacterium]